MDVNLSTDLRNEVAKWLNSKDKPIDTGFDLMNRTGYKPHVYQILLANKTRRDIPSKLENQLRLFLRYYANPQNPIHKDEAPTYYQKNKEAGPSKQLAFADDQNLDLYPVPIKDCFIEMHELYTQRSILHHALKKSGESNTAAEVKERKLIVQKIDAASRRMDLLWSFIDNYKKNGYLPSEELVAKKLDLDKVVLEKDADETPDLIVAIDVTELKKQSDNWRIKLSRAKNKLKYQTEKKQSKENPMPAGPKRIALERKILKLEAQKLIIDTALAKIK